MSQEGTSDTRFFKKKFSHTRQLIAPPCAIKGEKQFFGGKVRPHSVGCQFSSTRMISDALEIKIYSNIWFNSNWCQFIKVRSNPLKAGRSRCPGSTPWANLGSIGEVAEVKLLILKICGLDIYGLVWKCAPLCEFLCFVLLFVVGCCVLSVHLINPDYFEKAIWFSCCLFGVISFPCGRRVLFIPQDKKHSR